MLHRSVLLVIATAALAQCSLAQTAVKGAAVSREPSVIGLYKAVGIGNKVQVPGTDGKFKFNEDGTFTFTRKTLTTTLVTHGTYTMDGTTVKLMPAKKDAEWPDYWEKTPTLNRNTTGDLEMGGLTYQASLIGTAFAPGLYRCEKTPAIHYFFDRNGGYKYTGQGMSTGEYWVEKETDATTKTDQVVLILNILRIDGKRVNFHQRIPLEADGGFTLEKKFNYHRIAS
jgi:hypothetical protein